MSYPLILEKVYLQPWLVKSETHFAIQEVLKSRLAGESMAIESLVEKDDNKSCWQMVGDQGQIAVIPVFGIIGKHMSMMETMCGGYDVESLGESIEEALSYKEVKSILLHINSPGGTVTGVPEMAEVIARASTYKNIFAYTDGDMCSAAYWLGSQAHSVYASPSASVGSIGVYMAFLDETRAMENEGVKLELIKAGRLKGMGLPGNPLSEEARAHLQAQVDEIYNEFTGAVKSRRPSVNDDTMQGQAFSGRQALARGLVDRLVNNVSTLIQEINKF